MENRRFFSSEQANTLIAAYAQGESTRDLAKRFGCDPKTVNKAIRRGGGALRPRGCMPLHGPHPARKYAVDENFFSEINTEQKAWILGFLAADSHISDKTGRVAKTISIKLKSTDRPVLEAIRDAMSSTHPITERDNRHPKTDRVHRTCELLIASANLVASLATHGLNGDKSVTGKPWVGPTHLMRHYWRGVVDGDGSILPNYGQSGWAVWLCGNRAMTEGFRDFVAPIIGQSLSIYPYSSIFRVKTARAVAVRAIVSELYDGCNIALPRKLEIARQVTSAG